ncbi:unnamed protein product [Timema podura]|uniref:Zinc finger PHD-type domain-containing protein n=1 Tax=Timema podura TaxID=61482 RepID=A0ABN7NT31_TIMPD|nr:unnamed protein product [Timema podura]
MVPSWLQLVEEDKKKLRADLTKSGKKWKNRRGGGLSAWKMGVEECFLCGKSGDLIDCYNKTCPKSYHLECVDLKKPPKERWICPWHCCDICEKRTSQRCSICTSAFCPAHSDGNLHFDSNQSLVCNKHSKDFWQAIRVVPVIPTNRKVVWPVTKDKGRMGWGAVLLANNIENNVPLKGHWSHIFKQHAQVPVTIHGVLQEDRTNDMV